MNYPRRIIMNVLFLLAFTGCAAPAGASGPIDLTVIAKDSGYQPATISVKAGQTVNLTFKNRGSVVHEFRVKGLGSEGHRVETKTSPGLEVRITFLPETPGTFPIVCEIPGHKEAGMVGELIVQ